jgi:hypothetical protein
LPSGGGRARREGVVMIMGVKCEVSGWDRSVGNGGVKSATPTSWVQEGVARSSDGQVLSGDACFPRPAHVGGARAAPAAGPPYGAERASGRFERACAGAQSGELVSRDRGHVARDRRDLLREREDLSRERADRSGQRSARFRPLEHIVRERIGCAGRANGGQLDDASISAASGRFTTSGRRGSRTGGQLRARRSFGRASGTHAEDCFAAQRVRAGGPHGRASFSELSDYRLSTYPNLKTGPPSQ